jgi:phage FluMu gp28-like protein
MPKIIKKDNPIFEEGVLTVDQLLEFIDEEGVFIEAQKKWIADESPIKVADKSRRIGWTFAEAADDTLYASSEEGEDVWYVGYNQDMAQEFINYCAYWAKLYGCILSESKIEEFIFKDNDEDKGILAYRIRFASGWRITALSSRPSNLRGKGGRVVIDEAAFHDDLDELIKAAMAFVIWGGSVRIFSSHNGEDNPFNQLKQDILGGRVDASLHSIFFMDAVKQGLYKRICLKQKKSWSLEAQNKWVDFVYKSMGDHADEELDGIPSKGTGAYFSRALIEGRMDRDLPVIYWKCPAEFEREPKHIREAECKDFCEEKLLPLLKKLPGGLKHFLGQDFGRNVNLTVIAPLTEFADLTYQFPFFVELDNVPFDQQEQILFYIFDRLPRFTGAAIEGRGNGQHLAERSAQKYGFDRIHRVKGCDKFYLENFPPYKVGLEDRIFTMPMSSPVVDDHRAVKLVKGVPKIPDNKINKGTRGESRHGDAAIACVNAYFAARNIEGGRPEYESVEESELNIVGAW